MTKTITRFLLVLLMATAADKVASAEGLPVAKYLEDPEHKNDIYGFYLNAVFTGISLANSNIKPPLFCMDNKDPESAFEKIDRRIKLMQAENRLTAETTVDSIMMDILLKEYPCK